MTLGARPRTAGTGVSNSVPDPWHEHRFAIESWLRTGNGLLLGVDFDGTLAPIADDPDVPRITPVNHRALIEITGRAATRVAVISGRAVADLSDRVRVPGVVYAGNHGLELRRDSRRLTHPAAANCRGAVKRTGDRLEDRLATVPGCEIEEKGLTLSVHVRRTPPDRVGEVRRAVSAAVAAAGGPLFVDRGKQVFEVRPDVEWDKGTTLIDLSRSVPPSWRVLYIGDDTTDEDAFRRIRSRDIGLVVGPRSDTRADYCIPTQRGVGPFLRWLAAGPVDGSG